MHEGQRWRLRHRGFKRSVLYLRSVEVYSIGLKTTVWLSKNLRVPSEQQHAIHYIGMCTCDLTG